MNNKPRNRPKVVPGNTYRIRTGCGNLYVTITRDEGGLIETFAHLGRAGQCGAAQTEAICRSVSVGLRSGIDANVYVKQLSGIKCPSPGLEEGVQVLSCADAISKALKEELAEKGEVDD